MNRKHKHILESIFATPVRAIINWKDIESLFVALGAKIEEGRESRVRILLNGEEVVFHRPHPQKETDKARIFHGEVAALKAVITFQGTTVDEIEQAFKDSIDDYLDWCRERKSARKTTLWEI